MKKIFFITLGLILLSGVVFGKIVATLSEVNKPLMLIIDKDQFYVIEKDSIYIYSLENYKFIKKFGRIGKGPGEFDSIISVIPNEGDLLVNSLGKISYFNRNGSFKNEKKVDSTIATRGLNLYPLKKGFVGNGIIIKEKNIFQTINLYDSDFKKVNELSKMLKRSKNKIRLLSKSFFYQTYKNKIFISSKTGLCVNVLNDKGDKLYDISYPNYKKRKFDKKDIRDKMKLKNKNKYELLKNRLAFPDFYPEILTFFISDDKIYIATWKWKKNTIEFFIFSIKGKFLKRAYIPFYFKDEIFPLPYPALTITGNNLYQIVENSDTEEWELHKNLIK